MKLKFLTVILFLFGLFIAQDVMASEPQTTRKERNLILEANNAFNAKDYKKAIELYNMALEINPVSQRAQYNLAVAMVKQADEIGGAGGNPNKPDPTMVSDADSISIGLKQNANKIFTELYSKSQDKLTRENSIYNSGNILFSESNYAASIEQYKKALRLNPDNENARHNLRVAQLKLQQQNQDNKDDNNQDQQKNQDKNQEKDKDKDQNDQQQQQQQQPQQPQQQPSQPKSNYENILNAAQQNEAKAREKLEKQQTPVSSRQHAKPW